MLTWKWQIESAEPATPLAASGNETAWPASDGPEGRRYSASGAFSGRANLNVEEPMRSARIYAQAGDDGGSAGGAEAEARGPVRRRDARWGWTRGSHFGREFAEWVVVWVRSRWRRG